MAKSVDMFATAAKVAPAPEKKKGKSKEQIEIGSDLDKFSAAVAVIKSLEGVKATYEAKIKETMTRLFSHMGMKDSKAPENFEGVGSVSTASCELRKRSSASVLTVEEAQFLQEKGISLEEKVVKEEAFLFNSAILADVVLRKKVSDALSKIDFGGIAPILHQEREVKNIVSEESIDQLFKLADNEEDAARLLPMVGVLAIKPKFDGNLSDAVSMLEASGVSLS